MAVDCRPITQVCAVFSWEATRQLRGERPLVADAGWPSPTVAVCWGAAFCRYGNLGEGLAVRNQCRKETPTRPLPKLTELDTGEFWQATRNQEFRYQRCASCAPLSGIRARTALAALTATAVANLGGEGIHLFL